MTNDHHRSLHPSQSIHQQFYASTHKIKRELLSFKHSAQCTALKHPSKLASLRMLVSERQLTNSIRQLVPPCTCPKLLDNLLQTAEAFAWIQPGQKDLKKLLWPRERCGTLPFGAAAAGGITKQLRRFKTNFVCETTGSSRI